LFSCLALRHLPLCTPLSSYLSSSGSETTAVCTLSLHDALPISPSNRSSTSWRRGWRPSAPWRIRAGPGTCTPTPCLLRLNRPSRDRKSTRLNSSHVKISYAVFCLQKKKPRRAQLTTLHLCHPVS